MASTSNAFRGRRRRQRTAELGEGFWGVADGFRPPAGVSDSRADETPIPRRGLQHLQSSEFWSHFSFLLRAGGSSWWQRWMHVRTTVQLAGELDRKSTRLNSSHSQNSYAGFCFKKKKTHVRVA